MKNQLKRREFILKSCIAGVASCALMSGNKLYGLSTMMRRDEVPDPKKLTYCGYVCPDDCKMKKASLENNIELKKEAYNEFKLADKGIAFDADKIFCYGCKKEPVSESTMGCTVRQCAIAKGIECCIECDGLTACDKDLWKKFPDFHKAVVDMQKKYKA